jgi:hypothetical protein
MTQAAGKIQGKVVRLSKMPKVGNLWRKNDKLVVLKENYYEDKWDVSIAGEKIGAVEEVPAWIADENFEGNPRYIYQCHPYGFCSTKAEAIGRLFAGWLVEQEIVNPDIWTMKIKPADLPDYM